MKEIHRYFICPLLPHNKIQELGGSVAANNFCNNLISGNAFAEILPYLPVGRAIDTKDLKYNDSHIKIFCSTRWRNSDVFRKLAFVGENIMMFNHIQRNSSVWFYNLPYTIIPLFLLIKLFKPTVKCNLIMLDFTPGRKGLKHLLNAIELKCINKMDGMIKLANSSLFTVRNSTCLPGVVPNITVKWPEIDIVKRSFLLSGVLSEEISMLSMVLETFSKLPDCDLHITGSKGNEQILQQYAGKYDNIHWHGQLSFNDYLELLHSVTFQLSTRDPQMPENQCNFPSKIMEALFHNRIIISTIQYQQLDGVKYFIVNPGEESFRNSIKKLASLSQTDLLPYANQGELVRNKYGVKVWNDTIRKIENRLIMT